MVSFEQATENVRKAFPKPSTLIDRGFEFRGKYVFDIYEPLNPEHQVESFGTYIYVLPDGKVVTADEDEIFDNIEEFGKAYDTGTIVDG